MRGSWPSHKRKKASKVTIKAHRKQKARNKEEDWKKLMRERFYT
jgi:hypothetical protein